MFATTGIDVTATAQAVHPPGALLDECGHPVLDDDGQPVRVIASEVE